MIQQMKSTSRHSMIIMELRGDDLQGLKVKQVPEMTKVRRNVRTRFMRELSER